MTQQTKTLLEAFETLPAEERRAFTVEILRRSLPFDSGPLADDEIGAASSEFFEALDKDDAATSSR